MSQCEFKIKTVSFPFQLHYIINLHLYKKPDSPQINLKKKGISCVLWKEHEKLVLAYVKLTFMCISRQIGVNKTTPFLRCFILKWSKHIFELAKFAWIVYIWNHIPGYDDYMV